MSVQIIEILNLLPALHSNLSKQVQEKLLDLGEKIYDTAYELVPVRTGDLQRSLYVEEAKGDAGEPGVVVGAAEYYGVFVELGTRFMAAQPFLTPAVEAHRNELEGIIGSAIIAACYGG